MQTYWPVLSTENPDKMFLRNLSNVLFTIMNTLNNWQHKTDIIGSITLQHGQIKINYIDRKVMFVQWSVLFQAELVLVMTFSLGHQKNIECLAWEFVSKIWSHFSDVWLHFKTIFDFGKLFDKNIPKYERYLRPLWVAFDPAWLLAVSDSWTTFWLKWTKIGLDMTIKGNLKPFLAMFDGCAIIINSVSIHKPGTPKYEHRKITDQFTRNIELY